MNDKEWIKKYPLSIRAWEAQRESEEIVITGDERAYYETDVAAYVYWLNTKTQSLLGEAVELLSKYYKNRSSLELLDLDIDTENFLQKLEQKDG